MELVRSALAVAALFTASPAWAHAQLRDADPAVGGTIHTAPAQVELIFSEALEPRYSTVVVQDAAGVQVDQRDLHVVGSDATHVTVGLTKLPPATYSVIWHATSVDTHKTEGSFDFTIAP